MSGSVCYVWRYLHRRGNNTPLIIMIGDDAYNPFIVAVILITVPLDVGYPVDVDIPPPPL